MAPDIEADDAAGLAGGEMDFAFDFYHAVRNREGNLFFSPYSIYLALAMTYAGAQGETKEQMAESLNYSLPDHRLHNAFNWLDLELARRAEPRQGDEVSGFQLNIANSIWAQRDYPFLPEYLDLLAENYGAGLRLTDFINSAEPARLAINEWISEQTEEKINDLIPQGAVNDLTRLVLANAIYFKANWLYPFEAEATQEEPFYRLDGSEVNVPMMSTSGPELFSYVRGTGYQAIELPYEGADLSMVLLVPDEGSFESFEVGLTTAELKSIMAGLEPQSVVLRMPKYKFKSDFSLATTLAGMGMSDAFSPDAADFSGMIGRRELYIQDVLHKAFVAVDEAGTEAAAATAIIVGITSMPMIDVELTIDHPFIFLIRDIPTGTILFIGRVLEPVN
jgi:serpin B